MLLQELCTAKYDWDCVLSEANQRILSKWIDDLETVSYIAVPRYYLLKEKEHYQGVSLHRFGDASLKGCCAVIYVCMKTDNKSCSS